MDAHASKVNNLTIKTVNGIRTLCKDNHTVTVLPLEEALTQFLNFLKASTTEASKRTTKNVCTVLAGHNAATLMSLYFFGTVDKILSLNSLL